MRRSYPRSASRAYQGVCTVCSAEFITGSPWTLYCSGACRQRAHRERMRDRQPLPLVEPRQLQLPAANSGDLEVRAWQGTPIQRRSTDGWVNATAMCQAGGKRWNHYAANDRTREYIAALRASVVAEKPCAAAVAGNPADPFSRSAGNPADPSKTPEVVQSITTGPNHLRGTWVHPRLAVDLARWISPAFAVWMDGWFLEILARGAAPHHHQPTTPGITVAAPTEREAMQLWRAAIEAETTRALRLTLGVTGRTDAGMRPRGPWRFVSC